MISPLQSQSEANSIISNLIGRKQLMKAFQQQILNLHEGFQLFKRSFIDTVSGNMQILMSKYQQLSLQKQNLEGELTKSKQTNKVMKMEVIQLKEMINEAVEEFTFKIQQKNKQITVLKDALKGRQQFMEDQLICHQNQMSASRGSINQDLEIINEESSNAGTTIREQLEQNEQTISQIIHPLEIEEQLFLEQPSNKQELKKTKSFIDNFRKTIEQSNSSNKIEEHYHSSFLKKQEKKQSIIFNTVFVKLDTSNDTSLSDSNNQIKPLQEQNINITRKISHPKTIFKKRDQEEDRSSNDNRRVKTDNRRFNTQPSPDKIRDFDKQNHERCKSYHKSSYQKKMSHQRSNSYEEKSTLKPVSKGRIKVTSKMMTNEDSYPNKKKSLVYLGGVKAAFRKFLIDLKQAIKNYSISTGKYEDQVKYQGDKKNNMRWGRGLLYYRNGTVYEGDFKENCRHGKGAIINGGVTIFEGAWYYDKIHGEGHLKIMKLLSLECSSLLFEGSYYGNFVEDTFHGTGTLYINKKQRIVSKFNGGLPVGEFTYYCSNQIEFGRWPQDF